MKKSILNNTEEIQQYIKDIRRIPVVSHERQEEIFTRLNDKNTTKHEKKFLYDELVVGNLRFVISVAKMFQNQGMDIMDLISEGNIGLMKAAERFDPSSGFKFISYAVWWIKQSILQTLNDNSRTIRLPVNVVQEMQKEKRENEKTNKDLSSKFATLPRMIDLDMHINEDGDTLIDVIKNENVEAPDEIFNTKDVLKQKMMEIMSVLDVREKVIVEDYYGITGTPRTLEDIGSDFGLTKERVRQIKEKALRKLRNECSDLFEYL